MQNHLHNWYRDYVLHKWPHRDRWAMEIPAFTQMPLVEVPAGRCPRVLGALRQRADRLRSQLDSTLTGELETGYRSQCYYSRLEDLAERLEQEMGWWNYDGQADILRAFLRQDSSYESYCHEYKIMTLIISQLRACAKAFKAVMIMERRVTEQIRVHQCPSVVEKERSSASLCNS